MALTVSVDEIVYGSRNPLLGARRHWKRIRLREVAAVLNGFAFKSTQFTKSEGMPLIRIRDVGSNSTDTNYLGKFDDRYVVEAGELLVGMDGDFNCARWRGARALLNQRVCKVTLKSKLYDPRFLEFVLPGYLKAINDATSSVTVKHLSSRTLEDIPLPFPPLREQEEIVAVLDMQISRLNKSVANVNRIKGNLRRFRAAVRKVAVEGPLTFSLADVDPSDWILPSGWRRTRLGELATLVEYGTSAKTDEDSNGIPVVRMGNIVDGEIILGSLRYLPETHGEFPKLLLQPGDLLFNRTNSLALVGKTAVFSGLPRPCSFASYLIRVRLIEECIPEFVSALLNSPYGRRWVRSVATQQVGQANVNGAKLRSLLLPLPPYEEQRRIVQDLERRMSHFTNLRVATENTLKRADSLRGSILRSAIGGRA